MCPPCLIQLQTWLVRSNFKSVENTINNDIVSNTCPTQRCESVSSRRNLESGSAVENRQILSLNPNLDESVDNFDIMSYIDDADVPPSGVHV